jgi:hypothetical protein
MLFTLLLIAMIGGFVLLLPISRRFGAILEQRLNGRSAPDGTAADVRQLEAAVHALQMELEQLSERQAFTESLLSQREPPLLP